MAQPQRGWTPDTIITSDHALSMGPNDGFGSIGCSLQIDHDKSYVTTAAHALPLSNTATTPQIFGPSDTFIDATGLTVPPLDGQPFGPDLAAAFDLVFVEASVATATFGTGKPGSAAVVPAPGAALKFRGAREQIWGTAKVDAVKAQTKSHVFRQSALTGYNLDLFIVVRFDDQQRAPDSYEGDSGSMFWFETAGKLFPVGHLVVVSIVGERFGLVGVFDRALPMRRISLS